MQCPQPRLGRTPSVLVCSAQESTKESPFFLMHGRDPRIPTESLLAQNRSQTGSCLSLGSWQYWEFTVFMPAEQQGKTWKLSRPFHGPLKVIDTNIARWSTQRRFNLRSYIWTESACVIPNKVIKYGVDVSVDHVMWLPTLINILRWSIYWSNDTYSLQEMNYDNDPIYHTWPNSGGGYVTILTYTRYVILLIAIG